MKLTILVLTAAIVSLLTPAATAQDEAKQLPPTHANVSYGPHASNVIDIWIAQGEGPRPLLVHPVYGVKMKEKADRVGSECHLLIQGVSTSEKYDSADEFLLDKLLSP